MPGSAASSRATRSPKGSPCALRQTRGLPGGSRRRAVRIAASSGSGFITMPGPPPYGRSSTVRCASCVCARGSSVPTVTSPRSMARPTTPYSSAPAIMRGKSVTTSILMALFQLRGPVHHDYPLDQVHRAKVPGRGEHPVLLSARLFRHHHRPAARSVHEMAHRAERGAVEVPHRQSHQVRPVVLVLARRWERRALDLDDRSGEPRCALAARHPLELGDETPAMAPPARYPPRDPLTIREPEGPFAVSQQPVGRVGIRLDVQPALSAVRRAEAPKLDPGHGGSRSQYVAWKRRPLGRQAVACFR